MSALQQRLVAFGYVLSVDGVFGSATEHAVAHFQRANGLTPSGVVGATTARYLGVATGVDGGRSVVDGLERLQHVGFERTPGSAVAAKDRRYGRCRRASPGSATPSSTTACSAPSPQRAVEHFQRANGLTPERRRRHRDRPLPRPHQRQLVGRALATTSGSSVAATASGGGLRRGSQGSSVRALQARLAGFGYVVEHDGVFGHLTERAVEHFQRANGLTPSGVVDAATARNLGLTSATTGSTSSTSGASGGALSVGSQGDAVARIQRQLQRAGFAVIGGADGAFGPFTRAAVRAFQRANGLTVTGRVDAATASALGAGGSRPSATRTTPTPAASRASNAGAIAVAAAMSQRGVAYRFATAKPGIAFDCSGLTAWAWAQAGVRLPFQSALQYATIPHVPAMSAPAGRPGVLPLADQPRGDVHRQQPDHRRDAARHRCDRPRRQLAVRGRRREARVTRRRGAVCATAVGAGAGRRRQHGRSDGAHRHRRDRVVVLDRRPAPG